MTSNAYLTASHSRFKYTLYHIKEITKERAFHRCVLEKVGYTSGFCSTSVRIQREPFIYQLSSGYMYRIYIIENGTEVRELHINEYLKEIGLL